MRTVKGASYFVYNSNYTNVFDVIFNPAGEYATFYTFDGGIIEKVESSFGHNLLSKMLDCLAPKPQPKRCELHFYTPFKFPREIKSIPGWFAFFFDKHNNVIESFRCDKETEMLWYSPSESSVYKTCSFYENPQDFPLDLSICTFTKNHSVTCGDVPEKLPKENGDLNEVVKWLDNLEHSLYKP